MDSSIQRLGAGALALFTLLAPGTVTSCSDDDGPDEPVMHQNYVQGKLNGHVIAMNDVNANILMDKSDYNFSSDNESDVPTRFDWQVKLVETPDTVITLYLHLDDLRFTNGIIYSPNDSDPIKTRNTCYATVEDLRTHTTTTCHPTHEAPVSVSWKTFTITVDTSRHHRKKGYDYTVTYPSHRWHGIEGRLDGTLTGDDASRPPLQLDFRFVLY